MLSPEQQKFKEALVNSWSSGIVARSEFRKFSGGLYASGTLANLDAKGKGIRRVTAKGQKCAYLAEDAADWVARRLVSTSRQTKSLEANKCGSKKSELVENEGGPDE